MFVLALLVAGLAVAWRQRDRLLAEWREFRGRAVAAAPAVSPAVADSAEAKLTALAEGGGPNRIALSENEVQSLVEYRLGGRVPASVGVPQVELREGRVRLTGRVATHRIAPAGNLTDVLSLLPDTTELSATGQLVPYEGERVALEINDLAAARVPLPSRVIPQVLDLLGRPAEAPLPRNAVALPLPAGAGAAYVSGDSLVVLAREVRRGPGS